MKPTPKRSPIEKRALDAAETALEASGLRYQSSQIPGLAHLLVAFAENELRLKRPVAGITVNDFVCAVGEMTNEDALQRVKELSRAEDARIAEMKDEPGPDDDVSDRYDLGYQHGYKDGRASALPPSSPVADSPTKDYLAACEVLPDSLGRPLAARIQLVLDNLRRESHIGCELRRELDGGIERDAKAVEERWPEAAAYLRSHTHIEDGV